MSLAITGWTNGTHNVVPLPYHTIRQTRNKQEKIPISLQLQVSAKSKKSINKSQCKYSHNNPARFPAILHLPYRLLLFIKHIDFPHLTFIIAMMMNMILKLLLCILLLEAASALDAANVSNELMVEKAYLNWVKQMPSSKQFLFQKAENKLKPCLRLKVRKKPRKGDFPTVQKAVNAVPAVNLCRVVICIGAGTFR